MPIDHEARLRLVDLIEERRLELGLTMREVCDRAGISYEALRNFRQGTSGGMRRLTRRKLDKALGWESGTVDAVLDEAGISGGEGRPKIPRRIEEAIRTSGLSLEAQERVRRAIEAELSGPDDGPDVVLHGDPLPSRWPAPSSPPHSAVPAPTAASALPRRERLPV